MAGIYIHIPFCKQKCHYCNFFSVASETLRKGFVDALLKEADLRKGYLEGEVIRTIYFGGGTPSLLSVNEIYDILHSVRGIYKVQEDVEITLEFNPDDVEKQKLNELKDIGINRISVGVQSFNNSDLKYLERTHTPKQSFESIEIFLKAGFRNITIDLIYGIPGSDINSWESNLISFIDHEIPHLSAYALTVENRTALKWLIDRKKLVGINENMIVEQFKLLMEIMSSNNFIHYEISNFARKGFYSKHNSLYWLGGYYLGLGPSAHSYNGKSRQWNISNIGKYKELNEIQTIIKEVEVLTTDQKYNEYVMTSLRTSWGIDVEHIENVFGIKYSAYFERMARKFVDQKLIDRDRNIFAISDDGKLLADGIAAELFL